MSDHNPKDDMPLSEDDYEQRMLDPHHVHDEEHGHGHVIVSTFTLLNVLAVLLVLTILTVFASRSEVWIAETFDVLIPQWVNVSIAMSIAVVKGSLVCLFFMQLKYDKRLNAAIFLFCLFAAALFLGLTSLDLGQRDTVYEWRAGEVSPGGRPVQLTRGVGGSETISDPIALHARQKYINEHGEAAWERHMAESAAAAGHPSPYDPPAHSTADKSRPGLGLNDPIFGGAEQDHQPASGGH
jgi:cytochrome c oxidase subunit 4